MASARSTGPAFGGPPDGWNVTGVGNACHIGCTHIAAPAHVGRTALVLPAHMEDGPGEGVRISRKARLDYTHPAGVHIGAYTIVTPGVHIFTHDFVRARHVDTRIGAYCFIGAGAIILPGGDDWRPLHSRRRFGRH